VAKQRHEQDAVSEPVAVEQSAVAVAEPPVVKKQPDIVTMKRGEGESKEFVGNVHLCRWAAHEIAVKGARDNLEAWAVFCDSIGHHPSPKGGSVEKV
jgi:hypothetical protein